MIYTHHSGREGTPSLPVFNEVYTTTHARGDYRSPHRFLRYTNNRHYQPIVPAGVPRPSEFRAPQLNFERKAARIESPDIIHGDNEDINYPWRKPCAEATITDRIEPTPITTLNLKDSDKYLEDALWVKIGEAAAVRSQRLPQIHTLEADYQNENSQTFNIQGGIGNGSITVHITNSGVSRTSNRKVGNPNPNQPIQHTATPQMPMAYYGKSLSELEKLITERNIELPNKVKNVRDEEERKKQYAAYLGGNDSELASKGRIAADNLDVADGSRTISGDNTTTKITTLQERVGEVLRQITTTTIIRTVTSVPSTGVPPQPPSGTVTDTTTGDLHPLTDEDLHRLLLSENLDITGDRETDIQTYRAERMRIPCPIEQEPLSNTLEMQSWNEGGNGERRTIFNTIININISPKSSVVEQDAQKRSRIQDEPLSDASIDPHEEYLDADENQSSPEPESPVDNDYSSWTAAALKRNAAARDPPIKAPCKYKAAETVKFLRPQLEGLDDRARAARNQIREAKRNRAKKRREAAQRVERPRKRLKKGGDAERAREVLVQGEESQGGETVDVTTTPAQEESGNEISQGFVVEIPMDSGDDREDSIKP